MEQQNRQNEVSQNNFYWFSSSVPINDSLNSDIFVKVILVHLRLRCERVSLLINYRSVILSCSLLFSSCVISFSYSSIFYSFPLSITSINPIQSLIIVASFSCHNIFVYLFISSLCFLSFKIYIQHK